MRTFLIAGNWKMNAAPGVAKKLANDIKAVWQEEVFKSEALLCPPFISIPAVAAAFQGTSFKVGAQNVHTENDGAYTGEISTSMLADAGCEYVIVGHSERREYFHETDDLVARKTKKVIDEGLIPIVCVGEVLSERKESKHQEVVKRQVNAVLNHLGKDESDKLVIAYEPVWAIGTGETATPQQAQEMHQYIRDLIALQWGETGSEKVRILYGGSMKPDNAGELLSQKDVDGGLIGGASLSAESYCEILKISETI
jgi:triosephosphate isomerase (TIM)